MLLHVTFWWHIIIRIIIMAMVTRWSSRSNQPMIGGGWIRQTTLTLQWWVVGKKKEAESNRRTIQMMTFIFMKFQPTTLTNQGHQGRRLYSFECYVSIMITKLMWYHNISMYLFIYLSIYLLMFVTPILLFIYFWP